MQTTAISVVSDIADIDGLEAIHRFMEEQDVSFHCLDMTTSLEMEPGEFVDCIVAKQPPILLQHVPIIIYPKNVERFLNSTPWHVFCCLVVLISVALLPICMWFDSTTRAVVFVGATVMQCIAYFTCIGLFRRRLLFEVIKTFDFWYLVAMQAVFLSFFGYWFIKSGVHVAIVVPCLVVFWFFHCLFAFGVDASPWSRNVRFSLMLFYLMSYIVILFAARFAEYIYTDKLVYDEFVNVNIDFYVAEMTPRTGVVTSLITLVIFFAKYALMMRLGLSYVMIWFEAKNTDRRVGDVIDAAEVKQRQLLEIQAHMTTNQGEQQGAGDDALKQDATLVPVESAVVAASARRRTTVFTAANFGKALSHQHHHHHHHHRHRDTAGSSVTGSRPTTPASRYLTATPPLLNDSLSSLHHRHPSQRDQHVERKKAMRRVDTRIRGQEKRETASGATQKPAEAQREEKEDGDLAVLDDPLAPLQMEVTQEFCSIAHVAETREREHQETLTRGDQEVEGEILVGVGVSATVSPATTANSEERSAVATGSTDEGQQVLFRRRDADFPPRVALGDSLSAGDSNEQEAEQEQPKEEGEEGVSSWGDSSSTSSGDSLATKTRDEQQALPSFFTNAALIHTLRAKQQQHQPHTSEGVATPIAADANIAKETTKPRMIVLKGTRHDENGGDAGDAEKQRVEKKEAEEDAASSKPHFRRNTFCEESEEEEEEKGVNIKDDKFQETFVFSEQTENQPKSPTRIVTDDQLTPHITKTPGNITALMHSGGKLRRSVRFEFASSPPSNFSPVNKSDSDTTSDSSDEDDGWSGSSRSSSGLSSGNKHALMR